MLPVGRGPFSMSKQKISGKHFGEGQRGNLRFENGSPWFSEMSEGQGSQAA